MGQTASRCTACERVFWGKSALALMHKGAACPACGDTGTRSIWPETEVHVLVEHADNLYRDGTERRADAWATLAARMANERGESPAVEVVESAYELARRTYDPHSSDPIAGFVESASAQWWAFPPDYWRTQFARLAAGAPRVSSPEAASVVILVSAFEHGLDTTIAFGLQHHDGLSRHQATERVEAFRRLKDRKVAWKSLRGTSLESDVNLFEKQLWQKISDVLSARNKFTHGNPFAIATANVQEASYLADRLIPLLAHLHNALVDHKARATA